MGLFYNKTLKSFYEECSSFIGCKKEFKKRFHLEPRREYDLNKEVKKSSEKLSHFKHVSNPASAALFLNKEYEMKMKISDIYTIRENLKHIDSVNNDIDSLEKKVKRKKKKVSFH